ncbi:MAG: hypothetical protein ACFB9M_02120 [Myxococcota bacterium]
MRVCLLGQGELGQAVAHLAPHAMGELVAQLCDVPPAPWVQVAPSLEAALFGAQIVVLCANADELAALCEAYAPFAKGDDCVVVAARGARAHFELPHETVRSLTCVRKLGILGGPLHTQEFDSERHATVVLATRFREIVAKVSDIVPRDRVTIEPIEDLVGLGVGGAYGHISSILTGLAQGAGLSDTARGLLIGHSMMEARCLGIAMGGLPETFQGIVGWGELIPRSESRSDRHEQLGQDLAQGLTLDAARQKAHLPLEGIQTARVAVEKAHALEVEVPVARALSEIFDLPSPAEGLSSRLEALLKRPFNQPGRTTRA